MGGQVGDKVLHEEAAAPRAGDIFQPLGTSKQGGIEKGPNRLQRIGFRRPPLRLLGMPQLLLESQLLIKPQQVIA